MEARRPAATAAVAAALLIAVGLIAAPSGSLAQTTTDPTPTSTPTLQAATDTPTPTDQAQTQLQVATDTPTPTAVATDTSTPTLVPTATATAFNSGVPCATDDPSNERVQRSERHGDDQDRGYAGDEFETGNGQNQVIVHNCTDNRLRVHAAIQLNTIPGRVVDPLNEAYAEGSCSHCSTFAVALQIDLYRQDHATDIEPQNYAVALNTGCTGCTTVARAYQYAQGVDDPNDVSQDIYDRVDRLSDELTAIQTDPSISEPDAESRIDAVIQSFTELGGSLGDQRDERDS